MNKRIKILINYFLGPLLFIVLSWSLYRQTMSQPGLQQHWAQIKSSWRNWEFWLAIFLMLANWGIEARKWQLLMKHLQRFSFFTAFKAVLSGCSVTMLTPNRVGEYGGRILYVEEGNRIKAISLTIIGSISQLLVTMLVGCAGLIFLRFFSSSNTNALTALPELWGNLLLYLSVCVTVVLLLFYFRLGLLVKVIGKIRVLSKYIQPVQVLNGFNNKQLASILLLSFIRYLVFVLQYVLLLQAMQVAIGGWLCFWLISVFYWAMAILPTLGFIELPLRVKASWAILKFYTANELGVGAAALGIWVANLVAPAIIGSLLILSIKIMKEK